MHLTRFRLVEKQSATVRTHTCALSWTSPFKLIVLSPQWSTGFPVHRKLPQVARIFVPAVKCPSCLHPNDFNFWFCQMSGYKCKVRKSLPAKSLQVDLQRVDTRLNLLTRTSLSTSYQKQTQSLKEELDSFLCALPGKKTLLSTSPRDVCTFLVWKDKKGKTQVYSNGCPHLGKRDVHPCGCPVRLSFNTLDSFISNLQEFHLCLSFSSLKG